MNMQLAPVPDVCAWCSSPKVVLTDEDGDPICTPCLLRPAPARETATEAAERLGVSAFSLRREARQQQSRTTKGTLPAHVWTSLARNLSK